MSGTLGTMPCAIDENSDNDLDDHPLEFGPERSRNLDKAVFDIFRIYRSILGCQEHWGWCMWHQTRMERCGFLRLQHQTSVWEEEELLLQAHGLVLGVQVHVFLRSNSRLERRAIVEQVRAIKAFSKRPMLQEEEE